MIHPMMGILVRKKFNHPRQVVGGLGGGRERGRVKTITLHSKDNVYMLRVLGSQHTYCVLASSQIVVTLTHFMFESTGSGGTNIFAFSATFLERFLTGENSSSNTCSSKLPREMSISGCDLNMKWVWSFITDTTYRLYHKVEVSM